MRITGGELAGQRLVAPDTREIRPMRDAVRQALFNIWGGRVAGARFLDLFAGTGGVGLEALSRGAAEAVFVDRLPQAVEIIQQNAARLGLTPQTRVLRREAVRALDELAREAPFDLIFVGPPYGRALAEPALEALSRCDLLAPAGSLALEVFHKERLAERYGRLVGADSRRYGDNLLAFYAWAE